MWRYALLRADLSGANLSRTDLSGANLSRTNLSEADLSRAYLHKTDLRGIQKWKDSVSIKLANLPGVKNPPEGFLEWAIEHGAVALESTEEWEALKEKEELDERGTSP